MTRIWEATKRGAKAVASGAVAGGTYLLGVWSEQATLGEAFSGMAATQWVGLGLSVFAAWGITYRTRNR